MPNQRQIPGVPSVDDPTLRNFLSAMREVVNNFSAPGGGIASAVSSTVTPTFLSGLSGTLAGLLDTSIPPTPTGFAVQGMRVNNFLTWDNPHYLNYNFAEIWRAPALMDAAGMTAGGSYVINTLGTINWSSIGATGTAIGSLVNGTSYIITALGTINWSSIGATSSAAVGSVFTYNGVAVTGTGGTVLTTAFTKNSTAITGTGGLVQFAPALSSAIVIGTSVGHMFVDSVDPGAVFAYWVRFVSNAGVFGAYNSSAGTIGATRTGDGTGVNGWNITAENLYAIKAWISAADIMDLAVTNAKISGTISSDNYDGSTVGWMLDKNGGNVNLNQLTVRDNSGNIILQSSAGGIDWGKVLNKTGFASISQIDLSNVSTYIASAAIGSAYIASAAIGTAHIQDLAVDTLKVAGRAITVPSSAYTAGSASGSAGSYVSVQTLYVPVLSTTDATLVMVSFGGNTSVSASSSLAAWLFSGLGTHYGGSWGNSSSACGGSGTVLVSIPANTAVTFDLQIYTSGTASLANRFISAMVAKR